MLTSRGSWNGTKCEFAKITAELEQLSASSELGSGIEQLKQKCANEVKTAIERQLAVMSFFQQGDTDPEVAAKRNQTVLTNLGAESEFATADNTLRRLGGSTSLKTVSDKHVVCSNKLYAKERWIQLTEKEKRRKWKWADASPEAKTVRELEK